MSRPYRVDAEAGLVYGLKGKPFATKGDRYVNIGRIRGQRGGYAHRYIWEAVNGPIPDGLQINHINGIKSDNRIANLELVTASRNIQHAVDTGLIPPCKGEDNCRSRLTEDDIRRIRELGAAGTCIKAIGSLFEIHPGHVRHVLFGSRWGHIEGALPKPPKREPQPKPQPKFELIPLPMYERGEVVFYKRMRLAA